MYVSRIVVSFSLEILLVRFNFVKFLRTERSMLYLKTSLYRALSTLRLVYKKQFVLCRVQLLFSGAFVKFRKATVSFVMPGRLSVLPSVSPYGTIQVPKDGFS
jgi:hypothetical protein